MIRPTPEDSARFAETCSPMVRAMAQAMRDRFKELGIPAPFSDDDTAWCDLADIAIRAVPPPLMVPPDGDGEFDDRDMRPGYISQARYQARAAMVAAKAGPEF